MSNKVDVTDMEQETKQELKPKLRFPEFEGAGEWKTTKIGDFIESYKGGAPLTPSDFVPYSDYEVIPKKAIGEEMWLKIDVEKPTYCNEDFYKENLQSVIDNTYLITTLRDLVPSGPSIGYVVKYRSDRHYILAQGVYGLKPKKTIVSDFLIHFSKTEKYRRMMQSVMVGSTQVHIRNSVYLDLPISVPTLNEQQKIADCLSSLDELIAAQSQKLDTLKVHKKGLMQQLFPAEGETLPHLRFPEFQEKWMSKKISEISDKISDGIHATPEYDEKGEYFFVNGNNLLQGRILLKQTTKRINRNEFLKHRRELGDSTILMSINGTIGNLAFYDNELIVIGKSACYLNLKSDFDKRFIYFLLQTDAVIKGFEAELTGSTIKNLSLATIKNTTLPIPPAPEQQKIAGCLSSLDELIAAQSQTLDTLQAHKKGLMQQLFPAPDEVEG